MGNGGWEMTDNHEANDRAETAATILLSACLLAFVVLVVAAVMGVFA